MTRLNVRACKGAGSAARGGVGALVRQHADRGRSDAGLGEGSRDTMGDSHGPHRLLPGVSEGAHRPLTGASSLLPRWRGYACKGEAAPVAPGRKVVRIRQWGGWGL